MNKISTLMLVFLLSFSFASFAENQSTNPNSTKPRDKEMNKPKPMSEEQQDYMLKMHDFSNRILTEKDPAKKEQLKKEQRQMKTILHYNYDNWGGLGEDMPGCCDKSIQSQHKMTNTHPDQEGYDYSFDSGSDYSGGEVGPGCCNQPVK
jgi:hypothetical protein